MKINTIYFIGFALLWLYFGFGFTAQVFLVSLLIALIPLATSNFIFALPLVILAYSFIFGDSTFAWLCIIFSPFHWASATSLLIHGIKDIWDID